MAHQLWTTQEWKTATEEEVICALFDAPKFLDPCDMQEIRLHHPGTKNKYLNLYYKGEIPEFVKKTHNL